ncbi:MAG TPA: hypothetical protein VH186_16075 [Chloroflexia bacterium]|nr:hypothetical protein [Chloroflexia bacterium]
MPVQPDGYMGGWFAFVFYLMFAAGGVLIVSLFYNFGLFLPRSIRRELFTGTCGIAAILFLVLLKSHKSPIFFSSSLLGLVCCGAVLFYFWKLGH